MQAETVKHWKDWSTQDIINWIVKMDNGKYKHYERIITIVMKKESLWGFELEGAGRDRHL